MSWVMRSPSCSHTFRSRASGACSGKSASRSRISRPERCTLRPASSTSSIREPSMPRRRKLIGAGYSPRGPAGAAAARPAELACLFTFFSRMNHEFATRGRSPTSIMLACGRVSARTAIGGNGGTIYAGELEIHPAEGLALATGQALTLSVREFELLVAMAQAARDDRHARGALPRRVGWRAARRRPLGRRVRLQAAHQARSRDARPPLHPHPPRLRLPLPTPTSCGRGAAALPASPHARGGPAPLPTSPRTVDRQQPSRNVHMPAAVD